MARDAVRRPTARMAFGITFIAALAACEGPADFDLRGRMGGSVDTSAAATAAIAPRPRPDDRGVISYPNYQVAIARRGDRLADVAERVGLPAAELARFNGIRVDDALRRGEVIALPRRVAEPGPATGAATAGPIRPAADVDVSTLAEAAINRADPTPAAAAAPVQTGVEPVRHKVERGETAFTIARRFGVSPRALADWNALDSNYALREGQFLLIPTTREERGTRQREAQVIEPGEGTPTPVPPSAAKPLPPVVETPEPAQAAAAPETPPEPVADIGQSEARPSGAEMVMPVQGSIIREFARGRSDGIAIGATAGQPVKAAASGSVAHVGKNDEGVQFLLIRHPDDLITVYMFVDEVSVTKGDAVSRGQTIARVSAGDPSFVQFEVRDGFDSVDPMQYLR
ncbi:LysM peptidoglycan-binding domain-containing M23 family metallopeptidase [Cognatishimia sp. F0-27]|uniref:LysM peptidoglycan-binding domain-containing M23 family metallopeptidase n=1 Tax=Cognatishimia sp. F0-27 TaxID=2816855 RepID=UPI001D0C2C7F|nr:LysM peptidoglycan-binding domain-containing M23 family metallopeptidase [Cognatishimia sp. F0-27]